MVLNIHFLGNSAAEGQLTVRGLEIHALRKMIDLH